MTLRVEKLTTPSSNAFMILRVIRRLSINLSLALALMLAGDAAPSHAQSAGATISGTVRSATGALLSGATIVARHTGTGFIAQARSGSTGHFTIRQLPLGGPYTVTIRAIGHRAEQRTGIELALGDQVALAAVLTESAADLAPVLVEAAATNARASRAGASTLVTADDIRTLPVLNRNFGNLTAITPLASGNNLAGARGTSTSFQVDGASVRQNRLGESDAGGGSIMTIEAVREFAVATNEYDVMQGRQGGEPLRPRPSSARTVSKVRPSPTIATNVSRPPTTLDGHLTIFRNTSSGAAAAARLCVTDCTFSWRVNDGSSPRPPSSSICAPSMTKRPT